MKSEFEFIHYIKKSYGLKAVGDDCAVLPKNEQADMVVTADLLVEDIDFKLEWTRPEWLGHKALAVSLSDIAAMGGRPIWSMLTIGVPEKLWETDFIKRFYEGWTELAVQFDVELVGGDVSRSLERLVIDSIIGGDVPRGKAVLRSGAKPGDGVFVSGHLGGASGGLRLLNNDGERESDDEGKRLLIERQLRPMPRVELGRYLLENKLASSMIDLSDGLSSDIHHICEESGVGADFDAALIPIDPNLRSVFDEGEALSFALNGGEDFELLFTVPQEEISSLETHDVTRIGTITEAAGIVRLDDAGTKVILHPSGYRHF